jgi:hypothetical protein
VTEDFLTDLERRFLGISTCSSCGMCREVAKEALAKIAEYRNVPCFDEDEFPGPPACAGGGCGEE